jgi:hypothetical protein
MKIENPPDPSEPHRVYLCVLVRKGYRNHKSTVLGAKIYDTPTPEMSRGIQALVVDVMDGVTEDVAEKKLIKFLRFRNSQYHKGKANFLIHE